MKMHTMSMPHLMFYAPNVTNEDIGAVPNLSDHSSLLYPFIDKRGIAEQRRIMICTEVLTAMPSPGSMRRKQIAQRQGTPNPEGKSAGEKVS